VDARLERTWVHAMSVTPDITGFQTEARNLRENFGSPVTFHVPQAPTWPAGTRINPDTGKPYSPMVEQTNAEFADVVKTALVILKQGSPLRPQADSHWDEVGLMSGMDIILDVDSDDYADIEDATEFTIFELRYTVEEFKPFGLAGQLYRYLVYGMEK
jgi:hypothetical protein